MQVCQCLEVSLSCAEVYCDLHANIRATILSSFQANATIWLGPVFTLSMSHRPMEDLGGEGMDGMVGNEGSQVMCCLVWRCHQCTRVHGVLVRFLALWCQDACQLCVTCVSRTKPEELPAAGRGC